MGSPFHFEQKNHNGRWCSLVGEEFNFEVHPSTRKRGIEVRFLALLKYESTNSFRTSFHVTFFSRDPPLQKVKPQNMTPEGWVISIQMAKWKLWQNLHL